MRTDWEGSYLDGRTADRQRVVIRPMRNGLQITTEQGGTLWWPYGETRQTQGAYAGEQVRLERGGDIPEALLIPDATFLSYVHRVAPEAASHLHDPTRRRMRIPLTVLAALAVVLITSALYLWGIPLLTAVVATRVPVAWEERLGQAVTGHLAPPGKRCLDPARAQVIQEISARLTAPLGRSPYAFRVLVVNDPAVNAFAAPGGYVVLLRGLLDETQSAEELAGVLAHEFQHVLRRHATRALLQEVSSGLLLAALAGDATGAMAYGLEGARRLGALRYSRQNEEEADREGMRMLLDAGIDPGGMITFFARLQKEGKGSPVLPAYLSTHPRFEDRIGRLTQLATQSQTTPAKLLPHSDWRDIRRICPTTGRPA
ncbi:MAG: M48 family metallopeptidase [candidate division NC10 bacterium]|nr:M48 family metallopeptidase [candidate division NC10 bacterium]